MRAKNVGKFTCTCTVTVGLLCDATLQLAEICPEGMLCPLIWFAFAICVAMFWHMIWAVAARVASVDDVIPEFASIRAPASAAESAASCASLRAV